MTDSRAERRAGPSTRAPAGSAHDRAADEADDDEPAGNADEMTGPEGGPPEGTGPAGLAWAGPAASAA